MTKRQHRLLDALRASGVRYVTGADVRVAKALEGMGLVTVEDYGEMRQAQSRRQDGERWLATAVMRTEILWVPASREVVLPGMRKARPYRVWTLTGSMGDPSAKPPAPKPPVHHVNAFLEDHIHDWNMTGNILRYYSRAVHSEVWILVEYTD